MLVKRRAVTVGGSVSEGGRGSGGDSGVRG